MRLDLLPPPASPPAALSVVCDLGCGDGDFLIGLLAHINAITHTTCATAVHGVGIDYNTSLLATAAANGLAAGAQVRWLAYDFNEDRADLCRQLASLRITHVFVYLVPKQLALKTVRAILTTLCESGVVVCCHKFQPKYLTATRRDTLMDLVVYERAGFSLSHVALLACFIAVLCLFAPGIFADDTIRARKAKRSRSRRPILCNLRQRDRFATSLTCFSGDLAT
ncbi:hypothetical protein B0H11DRAFT_2020457 [Mycena galericulata]|nr:hypothetical protein B0H11DRAFT_2020457 [Mycena galericulata]